ncbi:MAG: cell division cycle- protein [Chrysothrix sp. TS-e1954]|nr:MAG: cell division cycle- protein [Chrysothrix sp. TS-e1954]
MLKSKSDCFNWKPARGSSPTASLAADLSQNFHIDQSPQIQTPRRALFSSATPQLPQLPSPTEDVTTPLIHSSSPAPNGYAMDLSPLPHKPAFMPQQQPAPTSHGLPTPDPTPIETEFPSAIPLPSAEPQLPRRPSSQHQRKISNSIRPSLKKGYSLNCINSKVNGTSSNETPFPFGGLGISQVSRMPLETFAESPPSERKLNPSSSTPSLVSRPPPRLIFPNNGSPMGGVRRGSIAKPSGPRVGLSRRTQSLQYGNPSRPMRSEKRCCTEGSVGPFFSVQEEHAPRLPHFRDQTEVDGFPRITADTFVEVINGSHDCTVDVIDCRFEYEFEGGHIEGAINFNDEEGLVQKLFEPGVPGQRTLILHCEYSNFRAPKMAKFIRERDRLINQDSYPQLTYPEIYVLHGGYSSFFSSHRHLCYPQSYVEMEASAHKKERNRGLAGIKRRGKLSRAQTYAFGQSSLSFSSAPTDFSMSDEEFALPPLSVAFDPSASVSNSFPFPVMDDAMDIDFSSSINSIPSPLPSHHRAPPRRIESY